MLGKITTDYHLWGQRHVPNHIYRCKVRCYLHLTSIKTPETVVSKHVKTGSALGAVHMLRLTY